MPAAEVYTVGQLKKALENVPDDATVAVSYCDDVQNGAIRIMQRDGEYFSVWIIGSADEVW